MEEKKISLIALLDVLKNYSDEQHPLSVKQIQQHISNDYHITLDRRTFYRHIETLTDLDYDISPFNENGKGYYLREREFEKSEVLLLCNAIHSSYLIPNKASKELINKLLNTQSKYTKKEFKQSVYIENTNKKDNKQFLLNIEQLSEAINNKKVITFNYTKYNFDKELVNRREELYTLSPYFLIYKDEKTYVIGSNPKHEDLTHFRVDRMANIKVTNEEIPNPIKDEDPYEYAKTKLYMYHGEVHKVVLKCDNCILDPMIDVFGKDVSIEEVENNQFILTTKSSSQGIVYLGLQYLDHLEVIEPFDAREQISQMIANNKNRYQK